VVWRGYRAIALAAIGCAGLAACDAGGALREPGTPVDAAALPHPKAGLWQWSSHTAGQRQLCLSGRLLTALDPRPGCPVTRQVRAADGAFVVEARCEGGSQTHTVAVVRGDYASAFSLDISIDGASDHADYRYLGPCPGAQRPDDLP
jgi:hypothetical protein